MKFDPETVELLADALADRLDARALAREGWVIPQVVAEHLGVEVSYVYQHAWKLGAVRLGDGPKARLRFRLREVDAALTCVPGRGTGEAESGAVEPKAPRRRRRPMGTSPPLLPIHGPREGR